MTDGSGRVPVSFTVTGANPQVGSVVTGADGTVPFCYSGETAGEDTVAAVAVAGVGGGEARCRAPY